MLKYIELILFVMLFSVVADATNLNLSRSNLYRSQQTPAPNTTRGNLNSSKSNKVQSTPAPNNSGTTVKSKKSNSSE